MVGRKVGGEAGFRGGAIGMGVIYLYFSISRAYGKVFLDNPGELPQNCPQWFNLL